MGICIKSYAFRMFENNIFFMEICLHHKENDHEIAEKLVNTGKFNLFSQKIKKVFEFS